MSSAAETPFALDLVRHTAEIVAAYLRGNQGAADDLPGLIRTVHAALGETRYPAIEPAADPQTPVVPIKRSIFADCIVCLEDGKRFKTLKRHLRSVYDLTPDVYRKRWGLPASDPMVAPHHAKRRSALAREIGLGRKAGPALAEPVTQRIPARPSGARKRKTKPTR